MDDRQAELCERLDATLDVHGPTAAAERLCDELRAAGDYQNLFYAMLMRTRVRLSVSPFPTGSASELPAEHHDAYEVAIREAAREVGNLYLAQEDIPKAWPFFRLIDEPEPIRRAIAEYAPGSEDDPFPVVEIAWQQGISPEKGFDLVLDRNGVCSAITLVSSTDLNRNPDLRSYCVRRLVRALHEQLVERLRADLTASGATISESATVAQLIDGQGEALAEDSYHVDVSHLSSVVQMALQLPPCPELELARELCDYGRRLSAGLRGRDDPPFENTYEDYSRYLDVVSGVDVEGGLRHFRAKLPAAEAEGYRYPAQVMVNLLLVADRGKEALLVAKQYLADESEQMLACPTASELARRIGDFTTLADLARAKTDAVSFLGARIASRG